MWRKVHPIDMLKTIRGKYSHLYCFFVLGISLERIKSCQTFESEVVFMGQSIRGQEVWRQSKITLTLLSTPLNVVIFYVWVTDYFAAVKVAWLETNFEEKRKNNHIAFQVTVICLKVCRANGIIDQCKCRITCCPWDFCWVVRTR